MGTLALFRDVADLTDRGLELTPKRPFCCDRDHGALFVLRGESGAFGLPLEYLRMFRLFDILHVDR